MAPIIAGLLSSGLRLIAGPVPVYGEHRIMKATAIAFDERRSSLKVALFP